MKKFDEVKYYQCAKKADKFFKENPFFSDRVTSLISESQEPKSVEDVLHLIHICIDAYENDLILKLNSKPFVDIFEIIYKLKQEDKELLKKPYLEILKSYDYDGAISFMKYVGVEKIPSKTLTDKLKAGGFFDKRFRAFCEMLNAFDVSTEGVTDYMYGSIPEKNDYPYAMFSALSLSGVFLIFITMCSKVYSQDENKNAIIKQYASEFLVLTTKLSYVQNFKNSEYINSLQTSLLFLTNFIAIDFLKVNDLFFSKDIAKIIQRIFSSKNRKDGWSTLDQHYAMAISIAEQRWKNGDARLHHQMALDLRDEIDEPICDQILAELLDKYPTKNKDVEQNKLFEAEKMKRFRYETLSLGTLKKKLKDVAKKYKKYHDPGAKYREANDL